MDYILYFTIYAFFGYLAEIIVCSISRRKLVGRGFLFGPVLPIYGFGFLLAILISSLNFIRENVCLIFLAITIGCTLLEYLTSLLLEKLFSVRLWDYTKSNKIQLHGRICLRNSIIFGLVGTLVVLFVQPVVANFVASIPENVRLALSIIFAVLFLLDLVASSYAAFHSKPLLRQGLADLATTVGDQTNEIKRLYRSAIKQFVSKFSR